MWTVVVYFAVIFNYCVFPLLPALEKYLVCPGVYVSSSALFWGGLIIFSRLSAIPGRSLEKDRKYESI